MHANLSNPRPYRRGGNHRLPAHDQQNIFTHLQIAQIVTEGGVEGLPPPPAVQICGICGRRSICEICGRRSICEICGPPSGESVVAGSCSRTSPRAQTAGLSKHSPTDYTDCHRGRRGGPSTPTCCPIAEICGRCPICEICGCCPIGEIWGPPSGESVLAAPGCTWRLTRNSVRPGRDSARSSRPPRTPALR